MTDATPQLPLFESLTSSSRSGGASSQPSSEHATSSSEQLPNTTTDATAGASTRPVPESSRPDGAGDAVSSPSGAKRTAGFDQQPMLPTFIGPNTADRMLTVPRPKTRSECRDEARPCPWVSCRHHLLLEVAQASKGANRAPSMRLNAASRERTRYGRRPGLRSSAAALVVRQWIDDAVELLSRMRYTCSLDVVEAYPDGLSDAGIAHLLGIHEQLVDAEARAALSKHRDGVRERGISSEEG